MSQPTNIVAALRHSVARIEGTQERLSTGPGAGRLQLGLEDIDALLGGGLLLGDLHELRYSLCRDIGSAAGFLFGLLAGLNDSRRIMWINDPAAGLDIGTLFPDGLAHFGFEAARLVKVRPVHLNDCLFSAGEAATSSGLAATILHVKGNPGCFDLSVSRKLMLRAQTNGSPVFVLRQAGEEEASSASTRWHIQPAPSQPNELFPKAVGQMRLKLTLEKNRNGQTNQWLIAWNPHTRSFQHARREKTQDQTKTYSTLPLHSFINRPDNPAKAGKLVAVK